MSLASQIAIVMSLHVASQIALYLSTISEYVLSACAPSLGLLLSESLLLVPFFRRLVVIRLLYEHYLLPCCVSITRTSVITHMQVS